MPKDSTAVTAKIKELEEQAAALRAQLDPVTAPKTETRPRTQKKGKKSKKASREMHGRVVLAPGYVSTTQPGSLYSTILRTAAAKGRLPMQDALFAAFRENATRRTARALLRTIGTDLIELEKLVREDESFREHAERRTKVIHQRSARGDLKARAILANPSICERGRWVGDFKEAIGILMGGRRERQLDRGRNVRILRRLKMMTDLIEMDGHELFVLFPRKHARTYRRARQLVGA